MKPNLQEALWSSENLTSGIWTWVSQAQSGHFSRGFPEPTVSLQSASPSLPEYGSPETGPILVSQSCHQKAPQTGESKHQEFVSALFCSGGRKSSIKVSAGLV